MLGPSPFALRIPDFSLRALAVAAGRAPLGGPRESVLVALVAARVASGALADSNLSPAQRSSRAEQARSWLATVAVPPVPKVAAARVFELSTSADPSALAEALAKVTEVTAPYLDRAARSELDSLTTRLRG